MVSLGTSTSKGTSTCCCCSARQQILFLKLSQTAFFFSSLLKFSWKEKTCWHVQAGKQKRATLDAKVVQKLQQKRPQSDFAMNFLAKKSLEKLNLAFWVLLLVFFIFFVNHQVITQVSSNIQILKGNSFLLYVLNQMLISKSIIAGETRPQA